MILTPSALQTTTNSPCLNKNDTQFKKIAELYLLRMYIATKLTVTKLSESAQKLEIKKQKRYS